MKSAVWTNLLSVIVQHVGEYKQQSFVLQTNYRDGSGSVVQASQSICCIGAAMLRGSNFIEKKCLLQSGSECSRLSAKSLYFANNNAPYARKNIAIYLEYFLASTYHSAYYFRTLSRQCSPQSVFADPQQALPVASGTGWPRCGVSSVKSYPKDVGGAKR